MTVTLTRKQLFGSSCGQFGGNVVQRLMFSVKPTLVARTRKDEERAHTCLPLFVAAPGVLRRPAKW